MQTDSEPTAIGDAIDTGLATKKSATCIRCGCAFDYNPLVFAGIMSDIAPDYCLPCDEAVIVERKAEVEKAEARKRQEAAGSRRAKWEQICPPLFLETDLNHRDMRQKATLEALAWQYGPKGLLMHAETGACKSRVLWELCRRAYLNEGRSVEVFVATDFAFQLTKSFAEDNRNFCAFIEKLRRVDLLALDDLGKERMTDRVQSELFGVIDWRMNYKLPIIVTSNYVGDTLTGRFPDKDTAAPLVSRLRASCHCVAMQPGRRASA